MHALLALTNPVTPLQGFEGVSALARAMLGCLLVVPSGAARPPQRLGEVWRLQAAPGGQHAHQHLRRSQGRQERRLPVKRDGGRRARLPPPLSTSAGAWPGSTCRAARAPPSPWTLSPARCRSRPGTRSWRRGTTPRGGLVAWGAAGPVRRSAAKRSYSPGVSRAVGVIACRGALLPSAMKGAQWWGCGREARSERMASRRAEARPWPANRLR